MDNVNVFCFLASYSVAFALELFRLLRRSYINRLFMIGFGAAGFGAHTIYLLVRSRQVGLPPLLSSTQDWVLVLAWVAVLFYLFVTTLDQKLAIGLFLLPLVLALIVSAYFVSPTTNSFVSGANPEQDAFKSLVMLHASLLVIGIACVLVGFTLSMMYLYQHRRLKHKQTMTDGLTLPNLARLARWNWWAVMISVFLLSLGMATGVGLSFWAREGPVRATFLDPVVIINGSVWLVMVGFAVWLTRSRHPRSKQVAWLTVWAFGFLLVTVIGTQVITKAFDAGSWHM